MIITLPGRSLSRAWLAVSLASSESKLLPSMYRAVHVEQFGTGLRLVSTDCYWLATCWIGAPGDHPDDGAAPEPGLYAEPDFAVTVNDDEHRLRDLFKHIAKMTRKVTDPEVFVAVDLDVLDIDDDAPPLDPLMAPRRAAISAPGERLLARVCEAPFPNWKRMITAFDGVPVGTPTTSFAPWLLEQFAKVPKIVGADMITLDWLEGHRGRWHVESDSPLLVRPRGVFTHAFRRRDFTSEPDHDQTEDARDAVIRGVLAGQLSLPAGRTDDPENEDDVIDAEIIDDD